MSTTAARPPLWLTVCFAVSVAILLGVVVLGYGRSYWYDEVFTLGFANIGRPIDWPLLQSDVHPPTYALLVRTMAEVFGMGPHGFDLRLVNLPAVAATGYGFWLLRDVMSRNQLMLLACLVMVNYFTLMLGLDLRSYALMLGFGFLAHVLLLRELSGLPPRHIALMLTCTVVWSLHFFGAAIALSILATSVMFGWRGGISRIALLARVALIAVLFGLFVMWVTVYSETLDKPKGNGWIRNEVKPLLNFLGWQGLAMLTALIALVLRRSGAGAPVPRAARRLLVPAAILLAAGVLISIYTPVISSRNTSVMVAPVLLFIVLATPQEFFTPNMGFGKTASRGLGIAGGIAVLLTLALGLRIADSSTRNGQLVRWAVDTALTPECDGAPVYVKRPDRLDSVAQIVFKDRVMREPINYPKYDPDLIPADCKVIGMGWHELGTVDDAIEFLTERGEDVEALLPPEPRLIAERKMYQGYVIIRRP